MSEPTPSQTSPERCEAAVVFADLAGSSALYRQLGDETAKECIAQLLAQLVVVAERYHGHLVKSIGDEIMLRFASAEDAGISAVKMQEQAGALGFAMRIGMSFGPVVIDSSDVFGDTVNQAAFLTQVALARQIIVAQDTVHQLPAYLRSSCQQFDSIVIKGSANKTQVYRLNWQSQDESLHATRVSQQAAVPDGQSAPKLILEIDGETRRITSKTPPFHLGRDTEKMDLPVPVREASRDHCHLLFHRGKFVLVDHSTNGTYIHTDGHPEAYIRRESTPLLGSGKISLGQPCDKTDCCITYRTTT